MISNRNVKAVLKDGDKIIDYDVTHNRLMQEGMTQATANAFGDLNSFNTSGIGALLVGLIDNTGFTGIGTSPNDTWALHPGWVETSNYNGQLALVYTEPLVALDTGFRVELLPSERLIFTFTAPESVRGAFILLNGRLLTALKFNKVFAVSPGQTLEFDYSFTIKLDRLSL